MAAQLEGYALKEVDKQTFETFLQTYPDIKRETVMICEPPLVFYFTDYELFGNYKWAVAKMCMDWMGPNGETDMTGHKRFYKYYIKA